MKRARNGVNGSAFVAQQSAMRQTNGGARESSAGRVLVVDNYDSFTYNLVQRLGELGADVEVVRNDAVTAAELIERQPQRIVLSPGPCTPDEAGISLELVRRVCGLQGAPARRIPILGVCLGHQSIGQAFGARVVRAPEPVHGKAEEIVHDRSALFRGVPRPLVAGRYHSLVVAERGLPGELVVSARTRSGIVMALRHRTLPVFGVQFHPESILTPAGQTLLRNFLEVKA
jgi:anthranilate synthase/aminodeoxychorismate synthase-like glutamine amidotransferase